MRCFCQPIYRLSPDGYDSPPHILPSEHQQVSGWPLIVDILRPKQLSQLPCTFNLCIFLSHNQTSWAWFRFWLSHLEKSAQCFQELQVKGQCNNQWVILVRLLTRSIRVSTYWMLYSSLVNHYFINAILKYFFLGVVPLLKMCLNFLYMSQRPLSRVVVNLPKMV